MTKVSEAMVATSSTTREEDAAFAFSVDALTADGLTQVANPLVQAALERVKHGKACQGFTHAYDRAYHSHTST